MFLMSEKGKEAELSDICNAAADDLRLLAMLHGGELSSETLSALRTHDFADNFSLVLTSQLAAEAMLVVNEGLSAAADGGEKAVDDLAADYADIYITHRLQVSPYESPWLDEDKLVNGEPMFKVRAWYEKFGLEAEDWRLRADDHMCLQMTFIAHLLSKPGVELAEVGRFMDEHMLRWLDKFAEFTSQRCATPFYAGLAMFTYAYMDELRTMIEYVTGEQRTRHDEEDETTDESMAPFAPGAEPGW
jgi:TorA maturation chaperone TorD